MNLGRFYFKRTESNNLIGEFSNDDCRRNFTESAVPNPEKKEVLSKENDDKFVGHYISTWYEENDRESVLAELKIEPKPNHQNIYLLQWRIIGEDERPETDPSFWGEAMISDGMLIGGYRGR